MLWLIFGTMMFVAALAVAMPIYREERRLSSMPLLSVVAAIAIAPILYLQIGAPMAILEPAELLAALAERLHEKPEDLAGWKMLGNSYLQVEDYSGAVAAFEHAVEIEFRQNGQTLSDLGEAVLLSDGRTLNGRAGKLFEDSLAITPNNQKALYYSGIAAIERGDNKLAANRWEELLATSPPPDVQETLQVRIAELRGDSLLVTQHGLDLVVLVKVSLADEVADAVSPNTPVYIIARDPEQPSPPVAVVVRHVSELPAEIPLGDLDAMNPERVPSAFETLEIIARVSMSGQPLAQPGDWFGQQVIDISVTSTVRITINQQIPILRENSVFD